MNGDWSALTRHLQEDDRQRIELTDDQLQSICASTDSRRPYPLDHTDPRYSIRGRAGNANYDVSHSSRSKTLKVFTKRP